MAFVEAIPSHQGILCDGCKSDPILGIRWRCMECNEYDLCDSCHDSGAHPAEHHMLKIEDPADTEYIDDVVRDGVVVTGSYRPTVLQKPEGDDDEVLLGLRIYTKEDAPVNISGQLRHGQLISWKK